MIGPRCSLFEHYSRQSTVADKQGGSMTGRSHEGRCWLEQGAAGQRNPERAAASRARQGRCDGATKYQAGPWRIWRAGWPGRLGSRGKAERRAPWRHTIRRARAPADRGAECRRRDSGGSGHRLPWSRPSTRGLSRRGSASVAARPEPASVRGRAPHRPRRRLTLRRPQQACRRHAHRRGAAALAAEHVDDSRATPRCGAGRGRSRRDCDFFTWAGRRRAGGAHDRSTVHALPAGQGTTSDRRDRPPAAGRARQRIRRQLAGAARPDGGTGSPTTALRPVANPCGSRAVASHR